MRRLLAAPLALAFTAVVAAQPRDDSLDRSTYKLSTTPAAAPVPALKYELRVRQPDKLPGNAALDYYRAALLAPDWPRDPKESETLHAKLVGWEAMPIAELPVAEVTAYLDTFAGGFEALDAAVRRESLDWRQGVPLSTTQPDPPLREWMKYREIARLNGFRVRLDLVRGDFNAAISAVRSGFRLSQAVGEGPILLNQLVGTAIGHETVGHARQIIGHPGSPNLYWALSSLPRPVIDPRPALEGEEVYGERSYRAQGPFPKDAADSFRGFMHDVRRTFALPYPRATAEWDNIAERERARSKARGEPPEKGHAAVVPFMRKCYSTLARLDRQMAGLMAVEAVRLHAAGAKGVPPAALADVTAVPVPPDPYTGRPFEYAANPDGFRITAPEDPNRPGSGFRYEVAFRR